jgi:hypothetical protein
MSNSSTKPSSKVSLYNKKSFEIVVRKRDGSYLSIGAKKSLRGVDLADFDNLPDGIEVR